LPDHHYSAYGNIEAAEDDEIDYFSQHKFFGYSAGVNLLLVIDDDLRRINGVAGHSGVGVLNKELEEKSIVLGGGLVEIAIPREGEIDLTVVA
jgi:hypothetical protein